MGIFRISKTSNYTVMSNHHFKNKKMSLKAKGLLSLMLSLPDTWDYSVSGLVTLSKDGKDSVMSALKELENHGYLRRTRTTDEAGRFSGIVYDIFEEPQEDSPISENPTSASQQSDKSNSENRAQLNTNSIKDLPNQITDESNTYEETYNELLSAVSDNEVRELYLEYIEMRKDIGSPLSQRGLKMLIDRVDRLSNYQKDMKLKLLETAIIKNWKSVYLPSNEPEPERLSPMQEEMKRRFLE